MGGENKNEEIADFPMLDRRMVRLGKELSIYKLSDGQPFFPSGNRPEEPGRHKARRAPRRQG